MPRSIQHSSEDHSHDMCSYHRHYRFPILQEQLCHLRRGSNPLTGVLPHSDGAGKGRYARLLSMNHVIFIHMIEDERGDHATEPCWLARYPAASAAHPKIPNSTESCWNSIGIDDTCSIFIQSIWIISVLHRIACVNEVEHWSTQHRP